MAPRKQVAIGFGQFKGEGPRFYLRQFSGFFFVLAGIMCLLAPQAMGESDAPLLGVDKKYLPFVALALVLGGTYLHETRPFKVRAHDAPGSQGHSCVNMQHPL